MTVAFNNATKSNQTRRFKNKTADYVYNFDSKVIAYEYIASPIKQNGKSGSFQQALKVTILIGQIFGLNPVLGIVRENVSELRFTFYSALCMYSIVSAIGQSTLAFFFILKSFWDEESTLQSNSGIIFFTFNTITTILFLRVANEWPKLCRHVVKIEEIDPTTDRNLVWKCNTICIVTVLLGCFEHCLSDITVVSNVIACHPDKPVYDEYLQTIFNWIWVYIPYNKVFGYLAKFFNIQLTFNWNYSSAFIMCVSLYLTARFQQINDRIKTARGQSVHATFWLTVREDYTKACNLVRTVDDIIKGITFLSFGNHLTSICFLMLHVLQDGLNAPVICNVPLDKRLFKGYDFNVYYSFSISLLMLRSLAMALITADVNSTSGTTALYLYEVSTYNTEIQRLITQVHGSSVALTGLNLFDVKRGMVLTIAAAIVTYELVLLQLTDDNMN